MAVQQQKSVTGCKMEVKVKVQPILVSFIIKISSYNQIGCIDMGQYRWNKGISISYFAQAKPSWRLFSDYFPILIIVSCHCVVKIARQNCLFLFLCQYTVGQHSSGQVVLLVGEGTWVSTMFPLIELLFLPHDGVSALCVCAWEVTVHGDRSRLRL